MGYLSDYENRVDLYIDSDRVDETLTDFPIMLKLSENCGIEGINASHVFTTISGSSKKIAITTSDGTTQCPVEVEYWDETEKKAILWTKIPTVYSGIDTKFYLYYDQSQQNNLFVSESTDDKAFVVIEPGDEGTYDTGNRVGHPFVIEDGGTYKMWYSAYDGTDWRILYADSTDLVNWSNHQMVVNLGDEGTYDVGYVFAPSVIKDGDTYKMWYTGYDNTKQRIIYCESTNGTTWSGHQMVLDYNQEGTYDTDRVSHANVIKESTTSYKMWYAGKRSSDSKWRVMYATSSNGTTWSNHQMIVDVGAEGTYDTDHSLGPAVIKDGSTYKMWYSGLNSGTWRIIHCDSSDGTNWSNHTLALDTGLEGSNDSDDVDNPCALLLNGIIHIWYRAIDSSSVEDIIYTRTFADGILDWSTPSQAVWSNNYLGVFHLSDDPSGGSSSMKDSTVNENHGNAEASMTSDDLVDGVAGKCIDFDGGDDYIQLYTPSEAASVLGDEQSGSITHSVWFRSESTSGDNQARIISRDYSDYWATRIDQSAASGSQSLDVGYHISGGSSGLSASNLNTNQWYYTSQVLDYSAGNVELYVDISLVDSASDLDASVASSRGVLLGQNEEDGPNPSTFNFFDGKIDEARISSVSRPISWLKADYYSTKDQLVSMQQFFPSHIEGTLYDQYGSPMTTACNVIVSELDGSFVNTGTTNNDGSYSIPVARGGPDRRFIVTFYLDERYRLDENLAGAEILTSVSGTV